MLFNDLKTKAKFSNKCLLERRKHFALNYPNKRLDEPSTKAYYYKYVLFLMGRCCVIMSVCTPLVHNWNIPLGLCHSK